MKNILKKIKEIVKKLPPLRLPLDTDYLVVETDRCESRWGEVLKCKPQKYCNKNEEEICRYRSENFKEKNFLSINIDHEILAIVYGLNRFRLFLISRQEILVRTNCEAILKFYHNKNSKRISQRRWLTFKDTLINNNYKIIFEHIKGKDNSLLDQLSRNPTSD